MSDTTKSITKREELNAIAFASRGSSDEHNDVDARWNEIGQTASKIGCVPMGASGTKDTAGQNANCPALSRLGQSRAGQDGTKAYKGFVPVPPLRVLSCPAELPPAAPQLSHLKNMAATLFAECRKGVRRRPTA